MQGNLIMTAVWYCSMINFATVEFYLQWMNIKVSAVYRTGRNAFQKFVSTLVVFISELH